MSMDFVCVFIKSLYGMFQKKSYVSEFVYNLDICYNLILTLQVISQIHYSNLLLGSVPALKLLPTRYDLKNCQHLDLYWEGSQGWEI